MKNLKKVLALVLAFACAFTMFAGAAFTDAADIEQAEAVEMLSALGVINGYTDGSFKPNDTISRAEAAKMIYTIRNGGNDDASAFEGKSVFTDVYAGHWAEGYINFCYTNGIINGKGNSKFAPDDKVTGTELAKMLLICMGYQADKSGLTGTGYTQRTNALASQNGLYDDVTVSVTAAMPRQFAAQIMYNALKADTVTWSTDANAYVKTEVETQEEVILGDSTHQMVTVTKNQTMGNKWMKLETISTVLTAVEKEDGRDTYSLNGEYTRVVTDYSNLLGQKVNVMTKDGDHSKVYGVYADEDSKVLATGTVGQLEGVTSTNKTKLNGTEYTLENQTTQTSYTAVEPEAKGVVCPNQGGVVSNPATLSVADLEGYNSVATVAGTVKLIDNNGNGKADVVLYVPAAVSQLTYVGTKSITGSNGLGSNELDDIEIYEGYAKDDWTTFTNKIYTVSGDTVINKIDVVTAKVDAIKTGEARVDGTWYKIAADQKGDTIDAGNTYALAIVGNYIVNADETEASSSDVLFVADYAAVDNSFTSSSTTQKVKAYFLDGSSKTITVEKAQLGVETSLTDITTTHKFANTDLNKLYSFSEKSNGNYELTLLSQANNKAGYENIDSIASGSNGVDANQKIAGKSVADEAVVFVAYGAGVDAKADVKVISGKTVNGWNSAYGDQGVMYATKKSNGIEYVTVAAITDSTTYAGIGSDYLYGYMTSNSYKTSKDGDTVTAYEFWNGTEQVTRYLDGTANASQKKDAGNLLIYTVDEGDFINVEAATDVKIGTVAITGLQYKSEGDVAFVDKDGYYGTYSMDEDCVYIAMNSDKQEGMEGSSLEQIVTAEETTPAGTYYANAYMVYNVSDKSIVAIIYDADNNRLHDVTAGRVLTATKTTPVA